MKLKWNDLSQSVWDETKKIKYFKIHFVYWLILFIIKYTLKENNVDFDLL